MKRIHPFKLIFSAILVLSAADLLAQRITVNGSKFYVGAEEIWLNGANTPWHNWNDFGTGNYNHAWWDGHMKVLSDNGINCIRVWISCNGGGIRINPDGTVNRVTSSFFDDLDRFFNLAENYQIYIFAALLSFDHAKSGSPAYQSFRNCFNDDEKTGSLVDHYVVPFVARYKDNPYLFAVDACNEIEWIHENAETGNLGWERLQYLAARMAAGVHDNSPVLFSVGSAAVKWNSESPRYPGEGNKWKDSALQAQCNDPKAFLDFYSPHWYGWVVRWFGNPCATSPTDYGIGDRPCIIGECPAKGMFTQDAQGNDVLVNNPADMYEKAYQRGWRGVLPWTSNGVDNNGSIADFGAATRAFRDNHYDLVYPSSETKINSSPKPRPAAFRLSCHPNPFNGYTNIQYQLDQPMNVKLRIYDLKGRLLRQLIQAKQSPGEHLCRWDGRDKLGDSLPSGMYLCLLNTSNDRQVYKLFMIQ